VASAEQGARRTSAILEQKKRWDDDVKGIAVPVDGEDDSLDLVIDLLEKQLDRAVASVKVNDDKAALVIPAVGVMVGIVGTNVRADLLLHPWLASVGFGTGVSAVAAIVLAILALRPQEFSNGVEAGRVVRAVGLPTKRGKLAYAKSLGFTVQSTERLAIVKATSVMWAFRVGATGVVLLTLFVMLGGFAGPAA
jgi:hypothetical protein